MDYKKLYQDKKVSPQEAVKVVQSGDWVDFGWCTATADTLDQALAARYSELKDVKVRGGVLLKRPAVMQVPDTGEHFTWNSWHMSGIERKMAGERIAYYNPMRYSELPRFYRENVEPIRAAMFQVSPMDEHGYFSFGPSASHMIAVCERSEYVIVEVNENMPRCLGSSESNIHISQVDMIVEGSNPPMNQLGAAATGEVDEAVAKLIVEEIPNGACLQLGIGGMPNAVGAQIAQSDLKDLGVHTEMYVDAYVDLNMAGKISGSKKNIDRFCQTYAFGAGTQKLYDFLDNNPACQATSVDYTNDVRIISQLDNFVSINNIIEMDLFGQVNAETAGTRQISGAGGQLDFVMGAYLSPGGKSFICCSSTYKTKSGELRSRIMPTLPSGAVVTDTRANVHWFVTEFGKVNLKGTSTWEKAEKIISVAHPEFRDELIRQADEMGIWRKSNK